MDEITTVNTSFSLQLPTLQLVIDQTSLGEFKLCPRRYYYRIVCGWVSRKPSFHLDFGIWMHEAREVYEHSKAFGADHEQALRNTIRHLMTATWNKEAGRAWNSGNKDKNRYTLLRTAVWYLDSYGKHDQAQTILLRNGKPAVELTFKFTPVDFRSEREFKSITGEPILFSGHMDRIVELAGSLFINDLKTTSRSLNDLYWAQFDPDNQVSFYTYAGQWALQNTESTVWGHEVETREISGVIIDAAQVKEEYSKFERRIVPRTAAQIVEWLDDAKDWIELMGIYAEMNKWPMNDKSCHTGFYGCPYQAVCARTPPARQNWLEADYSKAVWDPNVARGE